VDGIVGGISYEGARIGVPEHQKKEADGRRGKENFTETMHCLGSRPVLRFSFIGAEGRKIANWLTTAIAD